MASNGEIMKMLDNKNLKEKKAAEDKVALASYSEIWRDVINFRSHFNMKDCLTGLVLGLGNTLTVMPWESL